MTPKNPRSHHAASAPAPDETGGTPPQTEQQPVTAPEGEQATPQASPTAGQQVTTSGPVAGDEAPPMTVPEEQLREAQAVAEAQRSAAQSLVDEGLLIMNTFTGPDGESYIVAQDAEGAEKTFRVDQGSATLSEGVQAPSPQATQSGEAQEAPPAPHAPTSEAEARQEAQYQQDETPGGTAP